MNPTGIINAFNPNRNTLEPVNIPELLSKNARLESENAELKAEVKVLREIIELRNKESENILAIIKNMKAELAGCGIV